MNKPAPRIAIRVRLPKEDEYEKKHFREEVVYRWDRILGACAVVLVMAVGFTWATRNSEPQAPVLTTPKAATSYKDMSGDEPAAVTLASSVPAAASSKYAAYATDREKAPAVEPQSQGASTLNAQSAVSAAISTSTPAVAANPLPGKSGQGTEADHSPVDEQVHATGSVAPVAQDELQPAELARVEVLSEQVARAQLTNQMEQREPTDHAEAVISMDTDEKLLTLYFFTELQGLKGETVYHDWYLGDKRMARVTVRPQSNSVKAYSSKYIDRYMRGDWQVRVQTAGGLSLARSEFVVR